MKRTIIGLLVMHCLLGIGSKVYATPASGVCNNFNLAHIPVGDLRNPHLPENINPFRVTQKYNTSWSEGFCLIGTVDYPSTSETCTHLKIYYGHDGLDIHQSDAGAGQNDVVAVYSGLVVLSYSTKSAGGWGESVIVATRPHPNSEEVITHHYHHLHVDDGVTTRLVAACDQVNRGQKLGKEGGSPKWATHLHFKTRRWENVQKLKEALEVPKNILGYGYVRSNTNLLKNHLNPHVMLGGDFLDLSDPDGYYVWSSEYAKEMLNLGIDFGMWDGRFGVDEFVERRDISRWIKIARELESWDSNSFDSFVDLPYDDPDSPYVMALVHFPSNHPVINRYADCRPNGCFFSPERAVTKAEALKMVVLAFYSDEFFSIYNEDLWSSAPSQATLILLNTVGFFEDVDLLSWYAPYIYFALIKHIISPDRMFNPGWEVLKSTAAKWIVQGAWYAHDNQYQGDCSNFSCGANEYCDSNSGYCITLSFCVPGYESPCELGGGCMPVSCAELGYECGTFDDSCDGQINCGSCLNGGDCEQGICCECSFGPCCDGCNYLGTNLVCDVWDEQQCFGSNPGADVQQKTNTQYCSGTSSLCLGGSVSSTSWTTIDNCTGSEQCIFNGVSANCSTCSGNWSYSTVRSCGAVYCFEFDNITNSLTTISFSKLDNTPFGTWALYWRLKKNGVTIAETPSTCEVWNGSTKVQVSFPTANLAMSFGDSEAFTVDISVGPTQSACMNSEPAGTRSVSYLCQ